MKPPILVVDDDKDVRAIFKRRLENDGFRVMVAADRAELARAIQDELPHVIILDVALPDGVSGEFLSDKEKLSGLELGASTFLPKPFGQKDFLRQVRQSFSKYGRRL